MDIGAIAEIARTSRYIRRKIYSMANWITLREAIELTGYNIDHLRELLRAGTITGRKFSTVWQIDRKSLLTYLKTHQKAARDDKRFGPHLAKGD